MSYSTRAGALGAASGSMPGTPAGGAAPSAVPTRRPVGRPRKTAPAGPSAGSQSAHQAAAFSTPQPGRTAQGGPQGAARGQGGLIAAAPIGQTVNPYASAALAAQLRTTGPPKDGSETQLYLIPGPVNRMLLSVRSGVPSQIDWGMSKLVQTSYAFADSIQLEQFPGLYDQLLTFARRVARAWSGAPEEEWAQEYFEVDEPPEVYTPPEGHDDHDDESWDTDAYGGNSWSDPAGSSSKRRPLAFKPAQIPSHASLLRRALEASLVLRNLAMMPTNVRWLTVPTAQARARVKETTKVVAEVLRIARAPTTAPYGTDASGTLLVGADDDVADDGIVVEDLSTLELEGLTELKAYMLDLFETIAPHVSLERGAPPSFGVALAPRQRQTGNAVASALSAQSRRQAKLQQHGAPVASSALAHRITKGKDTSPISPPDSVFHSLLNLVHYSPDRNLVLASLRCLSALASYSIQNRTIGFTEREWEVVEVLPGGADDDEDGSTAYTTTLHSPGLLHLTALFIPLLHLRRTDPHPTLRSMGTALGNTALANLPSNGIAPSVKIEGDTDLGEAALDLLGQLVQIEGNALRMGLTTFSGEVASASNSTESQSGRAIVAVTNASAAPTKPLSHLPPASLSSFLALLLPFQRVAWLRSSPLLWNAAVLPYDLPSVHRHEATQRMHREQKKRAQRRMLGYREGEESIMERNMRKRLRVWETAKLDGLGEPDRAIKWMKLVFALAPDAELTQMEFWQSYQEEFRMSTTPLLNAADLIKLIAQVFPGASAMVVKPAPNAPQRFIIKGIDIRQREEHGPFECRWSPCERPQQLSGPDLAAHLRGHVQSSPAHRLQCRWGGPYMCSFVVPEYEAPSDEPQSQSRRQLSETERRDILNRHLLTHVQRQGLEAIKAAAGTAEATEATEATSEEERPIKRIRVDPGAQGLVPPATIDRPGLLYYTVARTPMDPATSTPIGTASMCAQILRTLARTASRVLSRAGQRPEMPSSLDFVPEGGLLEDDAAAAHDARLKALASAMGVGASAGGAGDNDKFGFPSLPQDEEGGGGSKAVAVAAAVHTTEPRSKEEQAVERAVHAHRATLKDIFGTTWASGDGLLAAGTSLGTGSTASDEAAGVQAAGVLMDALLNVEGAMIGVSGENDVLCPALNDALVELRPEGVRSVYMAGV